jgi:hypothetical protein
MVSLMNNNTAKEHIIINDGESRDFVTIGSNEEIPIAIINNTKRSQQTFQVLSEEEDENII